MLIIAMLLSCMPGASALTAEEWNAQCTVKTVKNTIVYRPDAAGNKTQVATIPAGTFVQQNAFDNASQMWNITFLTSNGATAWGLVSASSLEVTSVTIKLDDGTEVELKENLDDTDMNLHRLLEGDRRYRDNDQNRQFQSYGYTTQEFNESGELEDVDDAEDDNDEFGADAEFDGENFADDDFAADEE